LWRLQKVLPNLAFDIIDRFILLDNENEMQLSRQPSFIGRGTEQDRRRFQSDKKP
jgi:hypothetical protein